jgi:hypothetical protein
LGGREPIVKPTFTKVGFCFYRSGDKEVLRSENKGNSSMTDRRRYGVLNSDENRTALMKNQGMQPKQKGELM